jgi:hypothetical protein
MQRHPSLRLSLLISIVTIMMVGMGVAHGQLDESSEFAADGFSAPEMKPLAPFFAADVELTNLVDSKVLAKGTCQFLNLMRRTRCFIGADVICSGLLTLKEKKY